MFIILTNTGGPLQYIGLGLFFIQIIPLLTCFKDVEERISDFLQQLSMHQLFFLSLLTSFFLGTSYLILYPASFRKLYHDAQYLQEILRGFLLRRLGFTSTFQNIGIALVGVFFCTLFIFIVLEILKVLLARLDAFTFLTATNVRNVLVTLEIVIQLLIILRNFVTGANDREEEVKTRRIDEIVDIVNKIPLEEFIFPPGNGDDALSSIDTCSVSDLKCMLANRGCIHFHTFVERKDLIKELHRLRKFCDTCCICCEEYAEGDALRILPKCQHEFHVECFDQWAYTFDHDSKRSRDPCCPLCNTVLR